MFGMGGLAFSGVTAVSAGGSGLASNGTSLDPVSGDVVLGNAVGEPGNPGQLLSARDIVLNNFRLRLLANNAFGRFTFESATVPSEIFSVEDRNAIGGSSGGVGSQLTPIETGSIYNPASGAGDFNGIGVADSFNPTGGTTRYKGFFSRPVATLPAASAVTVVGFEAGVIVVIAGVNTVTVRGFFFNPVFVGTAPATVIAYENIVGDNLLNSAGLGRTVIGAEPGIFNTLKLVVNAGLGVLGIASFTPSAAVGVPATIVGLGIAFNAVHTAGNFGFTITGARNDTGGGNLTLYHTRSAVASIPVALVVNDQIGRINFIGVDTAANSRVAGDIRAVVESVNAISVTAQYRFFMTNSLGVFREVWRMTGEGGNWTNTLTNGTAAIHLKASTGTAGTAPFKYTAGVDLAAVEDGAKEFDGTNEFLSAGGVRYTLAKTLTAVAVLDFPNTVAGTSSDLTINVPGAADGDAVSLGVPIAALVANGVFSAFVSAVNTVTVRFSNNDLALPFDPGSGSFRVAVLKY